MLFFGNFLLRVGQERNGRIIFIFSISHPFTTYYGLKWIHNDIFLIFFLFVLNFLLRDGKELNKTIIFILSHSHPFPTYFRQKCCHINCIMAWNEAIVVFFNFLNFFPIFLEFSITRRVRTKRNDNFYFLYFSSFSNLL